MPLRRGFILPAPKDPAGGIFERLHLGIDEGLDVVVVCLREPSNCTGILAIA